METAPANGVKMEKVIEKVIRQPFYKRKDDFAEITQKLLKFVESNKLKMKQMRFTQNSGMLCLKMPSQKKENPGGDGGYDKSDDSGRRGLLCVTEDESSFVKSEESEKGGNSRRRRRARRKLKHAATDSSSVYESGKNEQLPIEGSAEKDIKPVVAPYVWMKQEKGELPAKPAVVLTESKAKTDEEQESEKAQECINKVMDEMGRRDQKKHDEKNHKELEKGSNLYCTLNPGNA